MTIRFGSKAVPRNLTTWTAAFGYKRSVAIFRFVSIFAALQQSLLLAASSDPGVKPGSKFHSILPSMSGRSKRTAVCGVN